MSVILKGNLFHSLCSSNNFSSCSLGQIIDSGFYSNFNCLLDVLVKNKHLSKNCVAPSFLLSYKVVPKNIPIHALLTLILNLTIQIMALTLSIREVELTNL